MEVKRTWEIISKSEKQKYIDELIKFFESERGETIGIIAAGSILDHFLEYAGAYCYNQGIQDAINFYKKGFENLEFDIDSMLKK